MADQPFWGRTVHNLGAGPKPLRVKGLSVKKLARAIAAAESEPLRTRAQAISQQIQNEDGVGIAVKLIGEYSNNFHKKH
jgi:UDP:flavonoid glycosyltransferase YjiC (YdhE family)